MNEEMNNNGVSNNLINIKPVFPNNGVGFNNQMPINGQNNIGTGSNISVQNMDPNNNVIPISASDIIPGNNTNNQVNLNIGGVNPNIQNTKLNNMIDSNNSNLSNSPGPNLNPLPHNNMQPLNNGMLSVNSNNIVPNNVLNSQMPINNKDSVNEITSNLNINNQNTTVSNNDKVPVSNNSVSNGGNGLTDIDKEELLRVFIGDKYDKIVNLKFSIPSFFFNVFYFYYRKMFLYGILAFMAMLILSSLRPFLSIATPIVLALLFKPLYMNHAKGKVSKIIETNRDKSKEEIRDICSKKGGTSGGFIFLGFLIDIIIVVIYMTILILIGVSTLLSTIINSFNNANIGVSDDGTVNIIPEVSNNEEYDGSLFYDTSVVILDEYNIVIPDGFTNGVMNSDDWLNYEYFADSTSVFGDCSFDFAAVQGYKFSEKLIKDMAKFNGKENTISTTNINGIKWDSYVDEDYNKVYNNATTKGNKVYLFTYTISSDDNKDVCENYYTQILNSISIRN